MGGETHFEVIGLPHHATDEEIRDRCASMRFSLVTAPEMNAEKLRRLHQAEVILLDPIKRSHYLDEIYGLENEGSSSSLAFRESNQNAQASLTSILKSLISALFGMGS